MKLEEQVLSLEQVRELQELGFDVEKHSSMCWIKYKSDIEPYEETCHLTTLDESCYETSCLSPIPTLTALDIIDILPEVLDRPRIIHRNYYLFITKLAVSYSNRDRYDHEFIRYIETKNPNFHPFENKKSFTICLFEALKWCIEEKHIEL